MARLNAGRSPGWRLVTQFPSCTTSRSAHSPPALRGSRRRLALPEGRATQRRDRRRARHCACEKLPSIHVLLPRDLRCGPPLASSPDELLSRLNEFSKYLFDIAKTPSFMGNFRIGTSDESSSCGLLLGH